MVMADLITIPEAADIKGVSRQYIHRLVKSDRLKHWKVGSGYVLERKDVEECEIGPLKGKRSPAARKRRSKTRK